MTSTQWALQGSSLAEVTEYALEEARSIQQAMVPREPLRMHRVEFVSRYRPVTEVGGSRLEGALR